MKARKPKAVAAVKTQAPVKRPAQPASTRRAVTKAKLVAALKKLHPMD